MTDAPYGGADANTHGGMTSCPIFECCLYTCMHLPRRQPWSGRVCCVSGLSTPCHVLSVSHLLCADRFPSTIQVHMITQTPSTASIKAWSMAVWEHRRRLQSLWCVCESLCSDFRLQPQHMFSRPKCFSACTRNLTHPIDVAENSGFGATCTRTQQQSVAQERVGLAVPGAACDLTTNTANARGIAVTVQ